MCHWGVDFRVSETQVSPSISPAAFRSRGSYQAATMSACVPHCFLLHYSTIMGDTSETVRKPQLNTFFYKSCHGQDLFTAIGHHLRHILSMESRALEVGERTLESGHKCEVMLRKKQSIPAQGGPIMSLLWTLVGQATIPGSQHILLNPFRHC